MTILITLFFILIWSLYWFYIIDISYSLTSSWAILAFWYWYKKYERDKELEIIEKYTTKYNVIKEKLHIVSNKYITNSESDTNIISQSYDELLDLYYIEFYLAYKWYIDRELWLEWDYWIGLDIWWSILSSYDIFWKWNKTDNYTWNIFIDSFIRNFKLYNQNNVNSKVKIDNKTFYEYTSNIILKFLNEWVIEDKIFIEDIKNKI